ncbi:GTPase [Pyrenophora tritici-repentis]|nr:GTPase [Pyrenophora tritici-repentis]
MLRHPPEKEDKEVGEEVKEEVEADPAVVAELSEPEVYEEPTPVRPRRSVITPTRTARRSEPLEELQPSKPSLPLGLTPEPKPQPQPITSDETPEKPPSEHAVTHMSLYHNNLQDFHWYWESIPPTIAQKSQANHFFTNHGKTAKLLRSVAQFRLFPESDVPEVAFVGRSNVGKSSLLNTLVNADIKALLARTSATPGFTKTMNLYGLGPGNGVTIKQQPDGRDKIVGKNGLTIVDMPGYGEGSLAAWGTEILKYIQNRKQLRRVFVLIDAQHGVKDKDRSLLATLRLSGVSHQVILSKLDKIFIPQAKEIKRYDGKSPRVLKPKGTMIGLRHMMEDLKDDIQPKVGGGALGELLGVSAETVVDGKRLGIDHVRYAVLKAVGLDELFKKDVSTPWGMSKKIEGRGKVRPVRI